jgi:hypothetical protein
MEEGSGHWRHRGPEKLSLTIDLILEQEHAAWLLLSPTPSWALFQRCILTISQKGRPRLRELWQCPRTPEWQSWLEPRGVKSLEPGLLTAGSDSFPWRLYTEAASKHKHFTEKN